MCSRAFHQARIPPRNTVLSGPRPPSDIGFTSDHLQVLYTHTDLSWTDPGAHLHCHSDEMFVILEGTVVFQVDGREVAVPAGEFCCFPAGIPHGVVRAEPPVRCLVIRAPAAPDKEYIGEKWRESGERWVR